MKQSTQWSELQHFSCMISQLRAREVLLAGCNINFMSGPIIVEFEVYVISFLFPVQQHVFYGTRNMFYCLPPVTPAVNLNNNTYISKGFDSN